MLLLIQWRTPSDVCPSSSGPQEISRKLFSPVRVVESTYKNKKLHRYLSCLLRFFKMSWYGGLSSSTSGLGYLTTAKGGFHRQASWLVGLIFCNPGKRAEQYYQPQSTNNPWVVYCGRHQATCPLALGIFPRVDIRDFCAYLNRFVVGYGIGVCGTLSSLCASL